MKRNLKNHIYKLLTVALISVIGLGYSYNSFADSPKNIISPDRHSVEVKGKINLYRVQVERMDLGKEGNKANAEVFVTLDSDPKMVYTLRIHSDSPASNKVMADTLRDAYFNEVPVTLYHQIAINKNNNYKILMVQLN